MKRKSKAFTLVELLIVIAIISILALVSVIGFNIYKKKAYISNDSAILEQVNICLKGQESLNGKPKTMHDALKQLAECGFKGVELKPQTEGYHFLYNFKDNKFCLVDEEYKEVYEKVAENDYDNWFIAEDPDEVINADNNYSIYLSDNYEDPKKDITIKRSIGFDTGKYSGYKNIEYKLDDANFNGELVLRTNNYSSNIEITAQEATINQYGLANSISVYNIGRDCFNVNGVIGRLSGIEGTININENAEVFYLDASSKDEEFKCNGAVPGKNVINLVTDPEKTLIFIDSSRVAHAEEGSVICNHTHGHKLVADDEYVYDVCKECGYAIKAKLEEKGNGKKTVLEAYELDNDSTDKSKVAVGEVITYDTVNGETKIQGISFFVGQELGIGYVTDVDKTPLKEYSYGQATNGVFSVSLEDYEGLLIDYDGAVYTNSDGEEEKVYPGAIVVKNEEGEIRGVKGYVDYSAGQGQDELTQEVQQYVKKEIEKRAGTTTGNVAHEHSYTLSSSKDATCTAAGYDVYKCSCGAQYSITTPALGHDYDDGINGDDQCNRCGKNHFFASGRGEENDPWIIKTATQLEGISHYYDRTVQGRYYKVDNSVNVLDCSNIDSIYLNGNFNGNGVEFTNLNKSLFNTVGHYDDTKRNEEYDCVIEKFTANMSTRNGNALVRNLLNAGTTTFKDIKVGGYIEGNWHIAPFYNYGTANTKSAKGCDYTVIFDNCKSNATLINVNEPTAVGYYVGHVYQGTGHTATITINNNCEFNGSAVTNNGKAHSIYVQASGTVNVNKNDEVVDVRTNTVVTPTKNSSTGEYEVELVSNDVAYITVSVTSQLNATDVNGADIANLNGITATLTRDSISVSGSADESKVIFGKVNSIEIKNNKGTTYLSGTNLKVYTGEWYNYTYGRIGLQVNQYNSNNELLANGSITVASKEKGANSWSIN